MGIRPQTEEILSRVQDMASHSVGQNSGRGANLAAQLLDVGPRKTEMGIHPRLGGAQKGFNAET